MHSSVTFPAHGAGAESDELELVRRAAIDHARRHRATVPWDSLTDSSSGISLSNSVHFAVACRVY
jgi:hypothetical protein